MPDRERLTRQCLNIVTDAYKANDQHVARGLLRQAIPLLVAADYSAEHAATTIRTGMHSTSALRQDKEFRELLEWMATARDIDAIPTF